MRALVLDEAGAYVRDAAIGEVGALAIRGPNVFAGYVDPAHEAATWIERDGARWLNTGDLARQDDEGYFWLTGRKKELIIRGGHNIDPKVIEEALAAHPAVALCAAIGRPDAHAGEVPAAYIQLRPGAACSAVELADFAEANIPERAAVPKAIRIIDALPTTAVGKVFKPALAMREIEDVVRAEAAAASIELTKVAVAQDATIGMVARISCAEGAHLLRERLERYAFAIDVTEHSQTHRELSNQS
jgi:fatty-acyl-CoA synthase